MDNLTREPDGHQTESQDDVVSVAEFPLRPGRVCALGTHKYRQRLFWHFKILEIDQSGHRFELRCQSFAHHTAEAFGEAFSKLLVHLRTEGHL